MSSSMDYWTNSGTVFWPPFHPGPPWFGWVWDLEMLLQKAIFTNVSFATNVTFMKLLLIMPSFFNLRPRNSLPIDDGGDLLQ